MASVTLRFRKNCNFSRVLYAKFSLWQIAKNGIWLAYIRKKGPSFYLHKSYFQFYMQPVKCSSNFLQNYIIQGVPYVLGRTLESLGPIMLTFWIFLLNYAKKQTFQWLIWCKLLFCSCTFIKDTGENVQHHFATLLYNLISKITIVIQTYKKSLNDQKWDLNWILGHWVQFWVLKR